MYAYVCLCMQYCDDIRNTLLYGVLGCVTREHQLLNSAPHLARAMALHKCNLLLHTYIFV